MRLLIVALAIMSIGLLLYVANGGGDSDSMLSDANEIVDDEERFEVESGSMSASELADDEVDSGP